MKIVAISDTHGQHEKLILPEGDMIIHAGDISFMGKHDDVQSFLTWFRNLDYRYKIFIAGNHDLPFERDSINSRKLIPSEIIYLENELVEIEGLRIFGSPVTPKFHNLAFNKQRGYEIRTVWRTIPKKLDILITHGPASKILDKNEAGEFCGCSDLRDIIFKTKPKFHIHGHIHDGYGTLEKNGITFINASVLDDSYKLVNKPITINVSY